MADKFSIEAKLLISGVDVKGDLNAGTLKFKIDTSALKKLVVDAAAAAKKVKAKFDNIKLKKLKLEVNKSSLKSIEAQIRKAVQSAVAKTKVSLQTSVAGGTKTDPFKAQRQAAVKSSQSLMTLHQLTKQVNQGLRSLIRTMNSARPGPAAAAGKGSLPFPAGARTISVGALGGSGGGGGGGGRGGAGGGFAGGGNGGGGVRQLAAGLNTVTASTNEAKTGFQELVDLSEQVGRKAAAFRGVAIAINAVVTASQAAAKFIIEFNDSLIEVNKILQLTDRSLQVLGNDLFELSAKTGVAVDQTIAISESFARAGLSGRGYGSIVELTDRALVGLQGTTLEASQVTQLFIQIIQQVEGGVRGLNKELITSAKLFDVLGKAEDITASKATDVQAAFKRSAASLFATGVSIEQATTLISVLQERTQRGGDVIGTALKTLASRISSSTSDATKALNSIGVATIDQEGNLRNLFEVLEDTAVAFNGLTESEQADVAVKAAGIRQVEVFRAAVQNFNRVQDVNNQLIAANGDAARKAAAEQTKLAVVIEKIKNAFQKLVRTASEGIIGEIFVGVITLAEKAATSVANLDRKFGGVLSTLTGLLGLGLGIKVIAPLVAGISKAIAAVGGLGRHTGIVASTVQNKVNPAIMQTAAATANANSQMAQFSASTAQAAVNAQRLAAASGGGIGSPGAVMVGGKSRQGPQFGTVLGGVEKQTSRLSKGLGKIGSMFKTVSTSFITLGLVASGAGAAVQGLAEQFRKAGDSASATAADVGGGLLKGAGQGVFAGSLIGGPVGAVLGGVIGSLIGVFEPLKRALGLAGETVEDLRRQYLKLGIVQSENGEITAEVSDQLDKALRNLKAVKGLEGRDFDKIDLSDPERDRQRSSAFKGARGSFDVSAVGSEFGDQLNTTINKLLAAQGATGLDIGGPGFNKADSPTLKKASEKTIREIEKALVSAALEFELDPAVIKSIVAENLKKIAAVTVQSPLAKRNTGAAIPPILKEAKAAIAKAAARQITDVRVRRVVGKREETASAIGSIGGQAPLGNIEKFLDVPVNRLEVALRTFIADLGREVLKLNEAQLKASTPQKQLADAMAENAQSNLKFIQERIALEKTDASTRAREAFSKAPNAKNKLFETLPQLIGSFAAEGKELDNNAVTKLREQQKTLAEFMNTAGNLDIADLFSTDEATAKEIKERFSRTTGDAAKAVFEALVGAQKQIAAKGIVDPNQQRQITASALSDASSDVDALGSKRFDAVAENAAKFSKALLKLDEEGFRAIIKTNALLVTALKKRISEEARLLSLDKRRREATALNARAAVEELTGIRRLVAEREIETQLINANIAASQTRLTSLSQEEAKIRAIKETESNRASILTRLKVIEETRANEEVKLSSLVGKKRVSDMRNVLQVAKLATAASKKVVSEERSRIGALADISTILSVDQSQLTKFNAELATLGAQFKNSQAQLAAEAAVVNATITDQAEKEKQLGDIKKRGAAIALAQAKAEADIIAKRREAIKQVSQQLLSNQQEQVTAQKAIIDATKGVSDAFENYLQAVDGAIMATTRYNLGLEIASIAAEKVTGGFTGIRDELGAVQDAFRDAEQLARDLGASESTLVDIRRESINQQLTLFNNLLQQQSQLARSFFTSSAQDQADLFQGLQEAQGVADVLGGSFEAFKKKGEGAINDLGARLLALPQEARQRVVSSLETLSGVGGSVGGFTADELLTAIETASLGVSGEGLQVDPLFEVQNRIAQLTEEQARLATEELITANEGVQTAKTQLEIAEAAKDLAEIQLDRIKEEGEKLRGKLNDLQGSLNTILLQQDQTAKLGFSAVTSAVARAANDVVTKLPDAFSVKVAEAFREVLQAGGQSIPTVREFSGNKLSQSTPKGRGREQVDARRAQGANLAEQARVASQGANGTVVPASAAQGAPTGRGSNNPNDPGSEQTNRNLSSILDELKSIKTNSDANLVATQEIRDTNGNQIGTAAATVGGTGQPEITINVEGTSTVTVTGFEAAVTRIGAALAETFGGFATEEEARRIANEVLDNIRKELLRRNIITPTTL